MDEYLGVATAHVAWGTNECSDIAGSISGIFGGMVSRGRSKSDPKQLASISDAVTEEIGDVLISGLLFCYEAGIDPLQAIEDKLAKNENKYPVEDSRGRSEKYSDL
jgi:hypothetical protein